MAHYSQGGQTPNRLWGESSGSTTTKSVARFFPDRWRSSCSWSTPVLLQARRGLPDPEVGWTPSCLTATRAITSRHGPSHDRSPWPPAQGPGPRPLPRRWSAQARHHLGRRIPLQLRAGWTSRGPRPSPSVRRYPWPATNGPPFLRLGLGGRLHPTSGGGRCPPWTGPAPRGPLIRLTVQLAVRFGRAHIRVSSVAA